MTDANKTDKPKETKEQRVARYQRRLAKSDLRAGEPKVDEGGSLQSLHAALIKGPTREERAAIQPLLDSLVLKID